MPFDVCARYLCHFCVRNNTYTEASDSQLYGCKQLSHASSNTSKATHRTSHIMVEKRRKIQPITMWNGMGHKIQPCHCIKMKHTKSWRHDNIFYYDLILLTFIVWYSGVHIFFSRSVKYFFISYFACFGIFFSFFFELFSFFFRLDASSTLQRKKKHEANS